MPAELEEDDSVASRKRKRPDSAKMLLRNSKVEVRSLDDGFLGSWHRGTVIGCRNHSRVVKYDNSLAVDGSNLIDTVPVSPTVDGNRNPDRSSYRGHIRPLPPYIPSSPLVFVYGLCVDVFHQESWWEGVVFDHKDGADRRLVFFPDLGDDLLTDIDNLRVSQDWVEEFDTWQNRGIWCFLQVIDEFTKNCPIPVSVKQIWYDLRGTEEFEKIKEWTIGGKSFWKELVMQIISENLAIAFSNVDELFALTASSKRDSFSTIKALSPILSEKKKKLHSPSSGTVITDVVVEANFSPYSIEAYLDTPNASRNDHLLSAVREHLTYLGWQIERVDNGVSLKFRYLSPNDGKYYYSLRDICQKLSLHDSNRTVVASPIEIVDMDNGLSTNPAYCPQAVIDYYELEIKKSRGRRANALRLKSKQHLAAVGWKAFDYYQPGGKHELLYMSPKKKKYHSLRMACKAWLDEHVVTGNKKEESLSKESYSTKDCINIQKSAISLDGVLHNPDANNGSLPRFEASGIRNSPNAGKKLAFLNPDDGNSWPTKFSNAKRVKKNVPCLFRQNPKNLISWLIDNNILLPREKVYCHGDSDKLAEGRVQRDGVKCSCCGKVFALSGFIVHAGNTAFKSSKSIILEDGRSLLAKIAENFSTVKDQNDDWKLRGNDSVCSICHFGGELILCELCPSSFHTGCLGLEDAPDGTWFCRSCCCCFCGKSNLKTDSSDLNVLKCSQCEQKFHLKCVRECVRERGEINLENHADGNWFCNTKCKKIFAGLFDLLGKPVNVGENLTWTLLQFVDPNIHSEDTLAFESAVENYVWLKMAVELMHECFGTVKDHYTKKDLIEDVVFSRRSELNRLNFQGFYTVVVKKGEELVSVAAIRIHGDKVAEMPLIGTRFSYRRVGMCRILMNKLEKILRELGVERLVLPAVPTMMNTWIASFGFSKMSETNRLQLLDYSFFDFPETIICQKYLFQNFHEVEDTSRTVDPQDCCL